MAGITIASGSPAPILMEGYVGETMYEGQVCESGFLGGAAGHWGVLDVAGESSEDAHGPIAVVTGVVNQRTEYDSTYKGAKCTFTTTSADMTGDPDRQDAATVQVAVIQPMVTVLRAPIYDGAFGTALTECTETVGSSYVAYTDTNNAMTNDIEDDYGTMYVRTGANRGLYRIMTTNTTTVGTTTLKFPWANAIGDKFVRAAVILGRTQIYIGSTANYVDGDQLIDGSVVGFPVFVTRLDLSTSGQEFCEFMVLNADHEHT
jgi:hypothetical protein